MTPAKQRAPGTNFDLRRRNWLAIALGTIVMMFSYFPYAAAFGTGEDGVTQINMALVGVALALAPFVFVTVGFVSLNRAAPRRVMQSLALLIPIGLGVGLLSPVLGATAGFGVGGALCLRPLTHPETVRNRIFVAIFTVAYTFVLLLVITPAGVFAGGTLPLLMLGFADEFTDWRATRS